MQSRLADACSRFEEVAAARAGTDELREQVVDVLYKWFVTGKEGTESSSPLKPGEAT
jgi:hypothetical protein